MHYVFLDANIYLDFYRFGADDLSEMDKLVTLINEKEISLITNTHLVSEVSRNRDAILDDSLQKIKANKFSLNLPKICTADEVDGIKKALGEANKLLDALHTDLSEQVNKRTLLADQLIDHLYASSHQTKVDEDIIERAELRMKLGNPPGKRSSLGDAIHWEVLLDEKILHVDIVSRDGDFGSPLVDNAVSSMLLKEWKENVGMKLSEYSSANLYSSLTKFFNNRYPDIQLSEEAKKNELIEQLRSSPSYASTHSTIGELSTFKNFTNNQVMLLFDALVENSQIRDIAADRDIREFYLGLQDKSYWIRSDLEEIVATALNVRREDFFFPF